jgi:hypothetical protein
LHPAEIPEWDAEDLMAGRLAAGLESADADSAREMLEAVRLELPTAVAHTEILALARRQDPPFALELSAGDDTYEYHLLEVPLSIVVPEDRRLVRLRLELTLLGPGGTDNPLFHDLFPRTEWTESEHDVGELAVDIGRALTFLAPAAGDVLGFRLQLPFRWRSRDVRVRASDRMSNPAEWYVTDRAIADGFTGYGIARISPGAPLRLEARLACELRRSGAFGRVLKAVYASDRERYELRSG